MSGKAANSLHSPVKPTAPGSKVAASSAANRTVLSNKQQPSASVVTPAKAGQKLPGPGKPGRAVAAVSQAVQSKAPVTTKAPESCSSSSSESEEEKETPTVKASAPKVGKEPAGQSECMCCALPSPQIRSLPYHSMLLSVPLLERSKQLFLGRLQEYCKAGSSGALWDESSMLASILSSRCCAKEFVCISVSIALYRAGGECSISEQDAALMQ